MIGLFDSGSGGLSVLKAIRARAPRVDVVYFGDIANVPYGLKSADELERLTIRAMKMLREEGATVLVSACNSVSCTVIRPMLTLLGAQDASIIEMVGPAVAALAKRGAGKTVAVATPATVGAGIYQEAFAKAGMEVAMIAIPDLASLVEFGAPRAELMRAIEPACREAVARGCDTFVLACTHYPLVRELFEEQFAELGHPCRVFDPADAVAEAAIKMHGTLGEGRVRFILSKDSDIFRKRAGAVIGEDPDISIRE